MQLMGKVALSAATLFLLALAYRFYKYRALERSDLPDKHDPAPAGCTGAKSSDKPLQDYYNDEGGHLRLRRVNSNLQNGSATDPGNKPAESSPGSHKLHAKAQEGFQAADVTRHSQNEHAEELHSDADLPQSCGHHGDDPMACPEDERDGEQSADTTQKKVCREDPEGREMLEKSEMVRERSESNPNNRTALSSIDLSLTHQNETKQVSHSFSSVVEVRMEERVIPKNGRSPALAKGGLRGKIYNYQTESTSQSVTALKTSKAVTCPSQSPFPNANTTKEKEVESGTPQEDTDADPANISDLASDPDMRTGIKENPLLFETNSLPFAPSPLTTEGSVFSSSTSQLLDMEVTTDILPLEDICLTDSGAAKSNDANQETAIKDRNRRGAPSRPTPQLMLNNELLTPEELDKEFIIPEDHMEPISSDDNREKSTIWAVEEATSSSSPQLPDIVVTTESTTPEDICLQDHVEAISSHVNKEEAINDPIAGGPTSSSTPLLRDILFKTEQLTPEEKSLQDHAIPSNEKKEEAINDHGAGDPTSSSTPPLLDMLIKTELLTPEEIGEAEISLKDHVETISSDVRRGNTTNESRTGEPTTSSSAQLPDMVVKTDLLTSEKIDKTSISLDEHVETIFSDVNKEKAINGDSSGGLPSNSTTLVLDIVYKTDLLTPGEADKADICQEDHVKAISRDVNEEKAKDNKSGGGLLPSLPDTGVKTENISRKDHEEAMVEAAINPEDEMETISSDVNKHKAIDDCSAGGPLGSKALQVLETEVKNECISVKDDVKDISRVDNVTATNESSSSSISEHFHANENSKDPLHQQTSLDTHLVSLDPEPTHDIHIDLDNCYEVLCFAKKNDLSTLKEAAYKVMSNDYLEVLQNPSIYGRLNATERDLILEGRMKGRRYVAVADIDTQAEPKAQNSSLSYYDNDNDAWYPLSPIPSEAVSRGCSMATMFNYLFLALGCDGPGRQAQPSRRVLCYNPLTDRWREISPLKEARPHCKLVALDGFLYAIGGECLHTVERYDPRQNRWTYIAPLPNDTFAVAHMATTCDDEIFVTGGTLRYILLRYREREGIWKNSVVSGSKDRTTEMVACNNFLYRFDLNRSMGISVHRCNIRARIWYECATYAMPYPVPFQCVVLDDNIYCISRNFHLRYLAEDVSPRFTATNLQTVPSPKGTLFPFLFVLPVKGT